MLLIFVAKVCCFHLLNSEKTAEDYSFQSSEAFQNLSSSWQVFLGMHKGLFTPDRELSKGRPKQWYH